MAENVARIEEFDDLLRRMNELDLGDIEERLRSRVKPKLTPDEYRAQKISFLYERVAPEVRDIAS